MLILKSNQLEDTKKIAQRIAPLLQVGDVIDLEGDMGAGKTTFTKFLCEAFGVDEGVQSPSFGLVNVYAGKFTIYHMDFYRLNREEELFDLDYENYFYPEDGVSLIEWSIRVKSYLPKQRIQIRIETIDENTRLFYIKEEFRGKILGDELRKCKF